MIKNVLVTLKVCKNAYFFSFFVEINIKSVYNVYSYIIQEGEWYDKFNKKRKLKYWNT